jgi:hypothetical protein
MNGRFRTSYSCALRFSDMKKGLFQNLLWDSPFGIHAIDTQLQKEAATSAAVAASGV